MLADASGMMYGKRYQGGTFARRIVFQISITGTLRSIASFNGNNGFNSHGGLIADESGNLFGTTIEGGASNRGTIFEVKGGAIKARASFTGPAGLGSVVGVVADASGNLYGTTGNDSAFGYGSVFELAKGGGLATLQLSNFLTGILQKGRLSSTRLPICLARSPSAALLTQARSSNL